MRTVATAIEDGLAAGALVLRDFIWIVARDRATGDPVTWGAWSGMGNISADVIDAASGSTVTRVFEGAGSLVTVGAVPLVTGLTVQAVTVQLSQITAGAEALVRQYDARRAPVQMYRGVLDPATMRLVSAALPRFSGFVDAAQIATPAEGGEGGITLTCVSHVQELVRSFTDRRSDADQKRRAAGDGFFRHAATVGGWQISWGQAET